jgi:hypothetical protein
MRTIIIIIILIAAFCPRLFAQEVIATAGSTLSNSNGSISYTIGEGVANTLTNGELTLTQGFQQANITVSMISELKDLDFSITAFPNPTADVLTLKLTKDDVTELKYLLFDVNGKLIIQKYLVINETTILVGHLAKGFYLLKVQDGLRELKTFKIIKQ